MPDAFKKISAGQPFRMGATAYNAFVDAAKAHRARQSDTKPPPGKPAPQGELVLIRNDSGGDLERYDILGIDGGVIISPDDNEPEFLARAALVGVEATEAAHAGRFAILQAPLADGKIGPAICSGLTACRIDYTGGHQFADVVDGDATQLKSGDSGGALILGVDGTGDSSWAWVSLGHGGGGGSALSFGYGKTDSASSLDATVTVSVWTAMGSAGSDTGDNITCYNRFGAIGSGKFVFWVGDGTGFDIVQGRC